MYLLSFRHQHHIAEELYHFCGEKMNCMYKIIFFSLDILSQKKIMLIGIWTYNYFYFTKNNLLYCSNPSSLRE